MVEENKIQEYIRKRSISDAANIIFGEEHEKSKNAAKELNDSWLILNKDEQNKVSNIPYKQFYYGCTICESFKIHMFDPDCRNKLQEHIDKEHPTKHFEEIEIRIICE